MALCWDLTYGFLADSLPPLNGDWSHLSLALGMPAGSWGHAMQNFAMGYTRHHFWMDGDEAKSATPMPGLGRKLWKYGWGLLFVIVMTVLSVYGPPTVYSKIAPGPAAASQPVVRAVK